MQNYPSTLVTSCLPYSPWAAALSHVTTESFLTAWQSLTERSFARQCGECSCQGGSMEPEGRSGPGEAGSKRRTGLKCMESRVCELASGTCWSSFLRPRHQLKPSATTLRLEAGVSNTSQVLGYIASPFVWASWTCHRMLWLILQ